MTFYLNCLSSLFYCCIMETRNISFLLLIAIIVDYLTENISNTITNCYAWIIITLITYYLNCITLNTLCLICKNKKRRNDRVINNLNNAYLKQ